MGDILMTYQLRALYYPWIAISNLETLQKALIYFDKVYVLCPPNLKKFSEAVTPKRDYLPDKLNQFIDQVHQFLAFYQDTQYLREEGILELIDPNQYGIPSIEKNPPTVNDDLYSAVLSKGLISDLRDPAFRHLPNSLTTFFLMEYMYDTTAPGWTFAQLQGFRSEYTVYFESQIFDTPESRYLYESRETIAGIRAYMGESIIINRTILASHDLDASPFTDQPEQIVFLNNKYERIRTDPDFQTTRSRVLEALDLKAHALALKTVETQIPNLEGLHWKDILEVREKAGDQLEHFRVEIAKLATQITTTLGSTEFDEEVNNIIRKTVTPSVVELEKKLRLSNIEVLKSAFTKAQSLKPVVPFAISTFVGVPLLLSLLISSGVLAVDTALNLYLEKRKIRESSGLTYLLNYK
jgi:hypothetical protein